jgi:hypothetical protein
VSVAGDVASDAVGPVLIPGGVTDALLAALRRRNPEMRVAPQGAYVRVLAPGRCRLVRADVEELLARSFALPGDLEAVMPAFKGRLAFTATGAEWSFAERGR